ETAAAEHPLCDRRHCAAEPGERGFAREARLHRGRPLPRDRAEVWSLDRCGVLGAQAAAGRLRRIRIKDLPLEALSRMAGVRTVARAVRSRRLRPPNRVATLYTACSVL